MNNNQTVLDNRGLVWHIARRDIIVPNHIDIRDLVQDAYVGLLENVHRFDKSRGFQLSTFIKAIVYNRMIKYIRKNKRIIKRPRSGGKMEKAYLDLRRRASKPYRVKREDSEYSGIYDIDYALARLDINDILEKGLRLKVISEKDKEVLMRYYYNDESFNDICKDSGVSKEAIKQRHNRAIEKLRWFVMRDMEIEHGRQEIRGAREQI